MGVISKEDFAVALRSHQAAVDATKSSQRVAAEAAKQSGRFRPNDNLGCHEGNNGRIERAVRHYILML